MAVGDENIIETDVVKIVPDLTGFRAELDAKLQKAMAGVKAKVKLVADATGFNATAKSELAKQATLAGRPEYKIKLVASAVGFNQSARAELAKLPDVEHKVHLAADLDQGDLRAKVEAAAAAASGIDIKVGIEADTEHLARSVKLALAAHEPYKVKVKADVDVDRSLLTRLRQREGGGGGGSAGGDAANLLSSAPRLINFGGEGVRPFNLLIAAAVALSPLLVAVGANALQAGSALAALGAAGIGAGVAVAGLVVGFQGIIAALKLRKTVLAEQVQQQAKTASAVDKAQKTELTNELTLHRARLQAARDLENLKQKFIDLRNQEKADTLSVAEAQDARNATYRNFFSTGLERLRSQQNVNDAIVRLSDTRLARKQNKQDLANFGTIENRPEVIAAKAAKAAAVQAATITSPAANLAAAIAKMSPAARELYHLIDDNQKVFDRLSRGIQQAVLPGFTRFLRSILKVGKDGKSSLSIFATAAGRLGGIVGDLVGKFGDLTRKGWFRRDFNKIISDSGKFMKIFGDAIIILIRPFMTIFKDSSPLLVRFAGYIKDAATWFDKVIAHADKTGKLQTFFSDAATQLGKWAALGQQILGFLGGIFRASAPAGGTIIDRLTTLFTNLSNWANSAKGQKAIKDFFDKLANLNYKKIGDFVVKLGAMFAAALAAKFVVTNPFFTALGLLAASNPDQAIAFMDAMTRFIIEGLGWVEKHKDTAELFLAIMAGARVLTAVGTLRLAFGALAVSGAVTAASLVVPTLLVGGPKNFLKGIETIPKGIDEDPQHPDALYKQWSAQARKPIEHWFAITLPQIMTAGGDNGWSSFKSAFYNTFGNDAAHFFSITLPNALNPGSGGSGGWAGAMTNLKHFFSINLPNALNLGSGGSGGWAGLATNIGHWFSMTLPNAITGGSQGWSGVPGWMWDQAKKGLGSPLVSGLWDGIKTATSSLWGRLTGWAGSLWDFVKGLFGVHSPSTISSGIGADLINGLWQGMVDRWTALLATVTAWIGTYITDPLVSIFATMGTSLKDAFTHPFTTLITSLAAPVKAAFDWIDVNLIGKLNALLAKIGVPPIPLIAFTAPTRAGAGSTIGAGAGNAIRGVAGIIARGDGGPVPGQSPHPRADNIPAMLTADEFVQPVDAVRHYGVDFMESVRTRRFPKFADGGLVGGLTKAVGSNVVTDIVRAGFRSVQKLSLAQLAGNVASMLSPFGGTAVGDPRVAETAEATARGMGATDKQLVALIEAGIVESGLRNLNYGDRDSLGFLQQRPSQGWGSAAQVQNVAYATRKFINAAKSRDKAGLTAGELAQAVQRSAYPDRYDQRLADAVAVLNRQAPYLTSYSGLGSTMRLGNGSIMGWQAMWAALHAKFPHAQLYSGLRPGARTLSGATSLHALGEAIDVTPDRHIAEWIEATYGAKVRELITPWPDLMLYHGKFHKYSQAVEAQHGVGGAGNDHIHWGMGTGGLVKARKYDTGGDLPPGYTLAYNGTGRNETVRTNQQERTLREGPGGAIRLDRRDMIAIASYIAGASSPTVQMDGREVARITNRYTYLPAGV